MEFGIQFLASSADCVAVQPTIAQAGTVRAGLLLANEDGAAAGAQLLTPTGTHSDLREFELEQHGRVSRVRAMELIERTQRFDLFHVAPS